MQYIEGIEAYAGTKLQERASAVTLGKFDGLHRGHQKLVEKVKDLAKEEDLTSIVCAFDMAPLLAGKGILAQVLMTKEERRRHLENEADVLVDCPFTEEFSQMEAEDFIGEILAKVFRASYVVVGTDFKFGHNQRGDVHMLAAFQKRYGYELIVVEKERYCGREISSTYIREALKEGDMPLAEHLLGYSYSVAGKVIRGRQLGRTLGFPTCNVAPPEQKLLPPKGVYLEQIRIDGKQYPAIGNVGVKPTVTDEGKLLIESYLLDYDGDAYEKEVTIELKKFCRPEQKFEDVLEMKQQIQKDIACGKEFFGQSF